MQGIELSKKFYNDYGISIINNHPEILNHVAIGLAGGGSECYGFDDEISSDHDFGPGFCIWIDDDYYDQFSFILEKEYAKLISQNTSESESSRLGFDRKGVSSVSAFYNKYIGIPTAPHSLDEWLYIDDSHFAEASNGEVFFDGSGIFTSIRNSILNDRPEDVRIKKLAAKTMLVAQYGQYNFNRCIEHGEKGAAIIALSEFVRSTCQVIFLLNNEFCPYYKWMLKSLRNLNILGDMADPLEYILWTDNEDYKVKIDIIEDICALVVKEFKNQGLSDSKDTFLETHAFEMVKHIKSPEIRNLHIMIG